MDNFSDSQLTLKIDRTQAMAQLVALGYKEGERVYLRFFFPDGDPRKGEDKGRKLEGAFPNLPWYQMEQLLCCWSRLLLCRQR